MKIFSYEVHKKKFVLCHYNAKKSSSAIKDTSCGITYTYIQASHTIDVKTD